MTTKKRPDITSVFYYMNKTVRNQGFANQILENRISTLTIDIKLDIKHTNDKVSYLLKTNQPTKRHFFESILPNAN